MENHLIKEADLADAIERIIAETSRGLAAARARGVIIQNPEAITVEFTYLVDPNAEDSIMTERRPNHITTTTTTDDPVISTTETVQGSVSSNSQDGGINASIEVTEYDEV